MMCECECDRLLTQSFNKCIFTVLSPPSAVAGGRNHNCGSMAQTETKLIATVSAPDTFDRWLRNDYQFLFSFSLSLIHHMIGLVPESPCQMEETQENHKRFPYARWAADFFIIPEIFKSKHWIEVKIGFKHIMNEIKNGICTVLGALLPSHGLPPFGANITNIAMGEGLCGSSMFGSDRWGVGVTPMTAGN